MKYVSIDIETTGLDPEKDDIVEFGAVIDDLNNPQPYSKLKTFHAYVLPWRVDDQYKALAYAAQDKHRRYHGDPYALSMHPTIFRRIAKRETGFNYYEPSLLVRFFKEWLRANDLTDKIVMAGKNFASFDLQFLKKIPTWYLMEGSYRTLDPTPLFIKVGSDKVPPSTQTCLSRAGLASDVTHTALEDATNVVRLVRHGFLVKEPADYSSIPDEIKPAAIKGTIDKVAPFAGVSTRTRGCSVVVGVSDGKLGPIVVPAK